MPLGGSVPRLGFSTTTVSSVDADAFLVGDGCSDHGVVVGDAVKVYLAESRRLLELAPPKETSGHHYVMGRLFDEVSDIIGDVEYAETQRSRVRHRAGPDAEGRR